MGGGRVMGSSKNPMSIAILTLCIALILPGTRSEEPGCFDGTLWEAAQAQPNTTLWTSALYNTGINQLLDQAKPGDVLFLPVDDGLYTCSSNLDRECGFQLFNWHTYLTNTTGAGLLMLHWAPGTRVGSEVELSNLGASNTGKVTLQTYLRIALSNQTEGKTWDLNVGYRTGVQRYIELPNAETSTSFNGMPFSNSSEILYVVNICAGNLIYVINRPLVPVNLPETSINSLPGLEHFCWDNSLQQFNNYPLNVGRELNGIFWKESFPAIANPRLNVTYFLPSDTALEGVVSNLFSEVALTRPQFFATKWPSYVLAQAIEGGYCPDYLDGKTLNSLLGDSTGVYKPYNFSVSGNGKVLVEYEYGNVTGQYIKSTCYSQFFLMDGPIFMYPGNDDLWPATDPTIAKYIFPVVSSDALLYDLESQCEPGQTAIRQEGGGPGVSDSSSSLSTGAIVGIAVGSAAAVALVAAAFIAYKRKKQREKDDNLPIYFNGFSKSGDFSSDFFSLTTNSASSVAGSINSKAEMLPAMPWSDFVLQAEDLEFTVSSATNQRVVLGMGRFGKVYQGVLHGTDDVAVKCIAQDNVADSKLDELSKLSHLTDDTKNSTLLTKDEIKRNENILKEVALLKACRSQHIVNFMGVCFQESEVQLVTELMHGGNLWNALRQNKINWHNGGNNVAYDVAAGLAYLHRHRVVHLDLKSSNILLTGDGEPKAKISDVGIARILPVSQDYLTSGGSMGTWNWCPPEIILGHRCTAGADIWSFGVVLWELCTGEPPIRGQMRDVKAPEECPKEVADLMLWCWKENAAKRPSAAQVVAVLQKFRSRVETAVLLEPSTSGDTGLTPISGEV